MNVAAPARTTGHPGLRELASSRRKPGPRDRKAPDWTIVAATLAAGALVTLVLGLLGSLPALAARPARALRTL